MLRDINLVYAKELSDLTGVPLELAIKAVAIREERGGFTRLEELVEIDDRFRPDVLKEVLSVGTDDDPQSKLQLLIEPDPPLETQPATLHLRLTYKAADGRENSQRSPLDLTRPAQLTVDGIAGETLTGALVENSQGFDLLRLDPQIDGQRAVLRIPTAGPIDDALKPRVVAPAAAVLDRSGHYRFAAAPDTRFDGYKLMAALVTEENKKLVSALLGQDPLQGSARALTLDAAVTAQLSALPFATTDLSFDGAFKLALPLADPAKVLGWAWYLANADTHFAGYRQEPVPATAQSGVVVLVPGAAPAAKDAPAKKTVKLSENQLIENADLFSDDPGSFCKPFSNPNRVLGEKSFSTVLRVEQPEIEAEGSKKTPKAKAGGLVYTALRETKSDTSGLASGGMITTAPFARIPAIVSLWDRWGALANPRTPVGKDNPIPWEQGGLTFQAASIARGHVLNYRMRWRSNGYSLGDVLKSLTLAPRQTRRVVQLDWRRTESARREEDSNYAERVGRTTFRDRDYADAVQSNLNEWSSGRSQSSQTGVAAGAGFAMAGFVIGGGFSHGQAQSSASQESGRSVSASEEQRLRDAIRQYADSLRSVETSVIQEVEQNENVTGVSEIIRNPNYCHSLTVIYHQILRHIRVDTELVGVDECLFVPFQILPFDKVRIERWKDKLWPYLKRRDLSIALRYIDEFNAGWPNVPPGAKSDQKLTRLSGSFTIQLAIKRPDEGKLAKETEEGAKEDLLRSPTGQAMLKTLAPLTVFLPKSPEEIVTNYLSVTPQERERYFQSQIAPSIARAWLDKLVLKTAGGTILTGADFTMAGNYGFNRTVRVDFNVPSSALAGVTRADVARLTLEATEKLSAEVGASLPKGSVANLRGATIDFTAETYSRRVGRGGGGQDDLVKPDSGDADSAEVAFPLASYETLKLSEEVARALDKLQEHLNSDLFYYHKAIWWSMDRDELYTLLDGFSISKTNFRSIASVVDLNPVAIMGNSLVFRVAPGAFLGIDGHKDAAAAFKFYKADTVTPPMRLSLPTEGTYAQALMDSCVACEEHQGSTDWVLNDKDPALADFPSNLFNSRYQSQTDALKPTAPPTALVNLQNAPAAPAPAGLGDVLKTVGSSGAFRDLAGLEGTQKNAAAAMTTAANLATTFGNSATALRLAEMKQASADLDKQRAALGKAVKSGIISKEDARKHYNALQNKATGVSLNDKPTDKVGADLAQALKPGQSATVARSTPTTNETVSVTQGSGDVVPASTAKATGPKKLPVKPNTTFAPQDWETITPIPARDATKCPGGITNLGTVLFSHQYEAQYKYLPYAGADASAFVNNVTEMINVLKTRVGTCGCITGLIIDAHGGWSNHGGFRMGKDTNNDGKLQQNEGKDFVSDANQAKKFGQILKGMFCTGGNSYIAVQSCHGAGPGNIFLKTLAKEANVQVIAADTDVTTHGTPSNSPGGGGTAHWKLKTGGKRILVKPDGTTKTDATVKGTGFWKPF
ncbi:helix-hairpin-helix domain-containing protein [Roseibium sediminicola]|uniref:Helix-hairpin-helix domain-containing protein n=1 Tax=Roseibium sediminicola TaxID=2933272 RepID=A0ABT0GU02_9HYPH|nr:helix-hairpin-helix domain-containing protein [Roseibium sp. CAU 1639]MCK7612914.1 helix-hairpin-helix domain-containing protein [Roseibium sp. CAU 1639]